MIGTKKGQAGAAVLVALLAILIILYVLFLPPKDRAALLSDGQPGGPGGQGTVSNTLFTSPVGKVYLPAVPNQNHHLPSLAVRSVESGAVLASADQLTAANNVFEKTPAQLLFTAEPTLTRNAVLSFNIASSTGGNVVISHNGNTIFNQRIASRSVSPITLTLTQASNNLTFSASSVGFAFWRTHRYTLTNVAVVADITDLSAATARQTFALRNDEYELLDKAELSFVPVCNTEGVVQIVLNGEELFAGTLDCGGRNTLEIAPSKLRSGENVISFSTRTGDFIIDAGLIETEGKQQQNRVFHFNVDSAAVQGRQVSVRILAADTADHRGTIRVNGNAIPFQGTDVITVPVTQYIRAGENTIQFEAVNKEFEVVKFDVLRS